MGKSERSVVPAKAGNQIDNQNAMKQGYYSKVMAETEKLEIEEYPLT
jgi:hypothetical protein